MIKHTLKPLCLAVGLAAVGSASATTIDFSESNFYMKFLDGNQHAASSESISTNAGVFSGNADQGQFTELSLVFKATISPKVLAGGRIHSRSSAAYWTDYGGFGNNGATTNGYNDQKFMKLRGAYVELSPGYDWLSQVRIGTSDWGMFDPFTVGKLRYIDRDNINGLYFRGPMTTGSTWEFARVSLPKYLQINWGGDPGGADSTQYNEAVYIAQFKVPVGGAKLAASFQSFNDHALGITTNAYSGVNTQVVYRNTVAALKADGSPVDGVDLRGAYYRSTSDTTTGLTGGGNAPNGTISDKAVKLGADWATPVDGLAFNFEYFNIGAGYQSVMAARRESDVLLTEGTESAWFSWGSPIWSGGTTADYTQVATNPWVTDNAFMDFNESPAQSSVGWKGFTALAKYDIADTPMSLELTRVGYNNNWQNYPADGPLAGLWFAANQDRATNIYVFKLNHNFDVIGGLDTSFKLKRVADRDYVSSATTNDDRNVQDSGATLSVGNQLFADLYGTLSYGRYIRDIKSGANTFNNSKSIYSVKFAYNLPGFEFGMLTQWIRGNGNPTETVGADVKIQQYRMKAYAQVNF